MEHSSGPAPILTGATTTLVSRRQMIGDDEGWLHPAAENLLLRTAIELMCLAMISRRY
jgi:hypothetical protein